VHAISTGRASDFYTRLFGWHAETVEVAHTTYLSLKLGDGIEGGIAEHDGEGSMWLPYVEHVLANPSLPLRPPRTRPCRA
jgi:predicted enzyme related to lactoylglutathione lyase